MEITITKDDFERALPVGTSAHDSVYESVEAQLAIAEYAMRDWLLGVAGMKYMEEQSDESMLIVFYKSLVCLDAFLANLRQLDLVLTPTGFGVVSNDNLAPASKQRVDALEAQLRTQYHKVLGQTLNLLRCENWGATPQARRYIPYLYDEYTYFFETHKGASSTDWQAYRSTIEDADEMLRTKMGDAQMEDMLEAFRRGDTNRLEPYRDVIALVVKFTDTWATKGTATLKQPVYRRMMRILDDDENATTFKLYRESASYKANHYEPYRNTKDSSGYVFNG